MQSTAFLRSADRPALERLKGRFGRSHGVIHRREDAQVAGRAGRDLAVGRSGPASHLGEDLLDHVADQIFGHLHGGSPLLYWLSNGYPVGPFEKSGQSSRSRPWAEKTTWPPTSTVSTSPITTASIGSFSVSGVKPGARPLADQDHFVEPGAQRVDHHERAAGRDEAVAALLVDPVRLDGQELVPRHRRDLLGRHHAAGHPGQEHGEASPRYLDLLEQLLRLCRATTISSLVGTVQTCTREPGVETWRSAGPAGVCRRVELDAEPAEVAADAGSNDRRVLADAAGEDDRIGAAELEQVGTQVMADRADEHVDGELGPRRRPRRRRLRCRGGRARRQQSPSRPDSLARMSRTSSRLLPVSRRITGRAKTSKSPTRLLCGRPDCGLMPRLHRDRLAVADGTQRRAAAEVARDHLDVGSAQELGHAPGDVAMAGAVEPPAADAQLGRPLVGDGVALVGLGNGAMEAGLERGDQRQAAGTGRGASASRLV